MRRSRSSRRSPSSTPKSTTTQRARCPKQCASSQVFCVRSRQHSCSSVSDILLKVHQLITLALNEGANEHEARNAAMKACKLIQEHDLLEHNRAGRRRIPRPVNVQTIMDDFDEIFKQATPAGAADEDLYSRARGFGGPHSEVRTPPPQPRVPGEEKKRTFDPDAKNIPILDPAWCTGCGQKIKRGAFATWSRGEVWHQPCWASAIGGL